MSILSDETLSKMKGNAETGMEKATTRLEYSKYEEAYKKVLSIINKRRKIIQISKQLRETRKWRDYAKTNGKR